MGRLRVGHEQEIKRVEEAIARAKFKLSIEINKYKMSELRNAIAIGGRYLDKLKAKI